MIKFIFILVVLSPTFLLAATKEECHKLDSTKNQKRSPEEIIAILDSKMFQVDARQNQANLEVMKQAKNNEEYMKAYPGIRNNCISGHLELERKLISDWSSKTTSGTTKKKIENYFSNHFRPNQPAPLAMIDVAIDTVIAKELAEKKLGKFSRISPEVVTQLKTEATKKGREISDRVNVLFDKRRSAVTNAISDINNNNDPKPIELSPEETALMVKMHVDEAAAADTYYKKFLTLINK